MAITYVGGDSDNLDYLTNTDLTLTLPTHQTDDVGVIFITIRGNDAHTITFNAGSGWTELYAENNGAGTLGYTRNACYYKRFTSSSETNPEIEHSFGGNTNEEDRIAVVEVFRGVDTTTIFDTTYTSADATDIGFSPGSTTPPDITTVNDSCCLIVNYQGTANNVTAIAESSGYSAANEVFQTIGSYDIVTDTSYLLDAGTASTESPGDWSWTQSTTGGPDGEHYTLALRLQQGTTHSGIGSVLTSGTLSADAIRVANAVGSVTTAGTLGAGALVSKVGAGSFTGDGTLSGDATTSQTFAGSGTITANGSLSGAVTTTIQVSSSTSASATLAGVGTVTWLVTGSVATSATLVGDTITSYQSIGSLAASANIAGALTKRLSAVGNLGITATTEAGVTFFFPRQGVSTIYTTTTPKLPVYERGDNHE